MRAGPTAGHGGRKEVFIRDRLQRAPSINFFRERLEFYLRDALGFKYDVVNAVLAAERMTWWMRWRGRRP